MQCVLLSSLFFACPAGPHTWMKHFPNATGPRQSPILINTARAKKEEQLLVSPLKVNLEDSGIQSVINTGHGFRVDVVSNDLSMYCSSILVFLGLWGLKILKFQGIWLPRVVTTKTWLRCSEESQLVYVRLIFYLIFNVFVVFVLIQRINKTFVTQFPMLSSIMTCLSSLIVGRIHNYHEADNQSGKANSVIILPS